MEAPLNEDAPVAPQPVPNDFNLYQMDAARTINPTQSRDGNLANFALGLAGEVGEVCEPIKKHLYHGKKLDLVAMRKELGDVLWYLSSVCFVLNLDLAEVAAENIAKLKARWPDGFKVAD